jgi:gamma-D-glutamyl-L-lysine dipeptidyl-peptidase
MINNKLLLDVFENKECKSKLSTQILYGEKFRILSKNRYSYKIKTSFDNYIGYIKKQRYLNKLIITHKVFKIKTKIFTKPFNNKKFETKNFLSFASKVSVIQVQNGYVEFEKNKWIKQQDLKKIDHTEKNYSKIFKLFLDTKYTWGGKSFAGIDCSALIQLFFLYNKKFYPRDTKDQIKFKKRNINSKIFKKGDIIFWNGHVAICIDGKKLIHAFGPKKKVIIMDIKKTIKQIQNNSKLYVIGKKNINDY